MPRPIEMGTRTRRNQLTRVGVMPRRRARLGGLPRCGVSEAKAFGRAHTRPMVLRVAPTQRGYQIQAKVK